MRLGVQPLSIAVAGLSAIALAVSGCTGDSEAEAESPPAATTGQVETRPPAQSAVDIPTLRAAFEETYGQRPWYGLITGMKMGAPIVTPNRVYRTLEVTMKLDPAIEVDTGTICEAAFGAADNAGMGGEFEVVRVIGSDGREGGCA